MPDSSRFGLSSPRCHRTPKEPWRQRTSSSTGSTRSSGGRSSLDGVRYRTEGPWHPHHALGHEAPLHSLPARGLRGSGRPSTMPAPCRNGNLAGLLDREGRTLRGRRTGSPPRTALEASYPRGQPAPSSQTDPALLRWPHDQRHARQNVAAWFRSLHATPVAANRSAPVTAHPPLIMDRFLAAFGSGHLLLSPSLAERRVPVGRNRSGLRPFPARGDRAERLTAQDAFRPPAPFRGMGVQLNGPGVMFSPVVSGPCSWTGRRIVCPCVRRGRSGTFGATTGKVLRTPPGRGFRRREGRDQ